MKSFRCHRTDQASVTRVRTKSVLVGYGEYSAIAVGYMGPLEVGVGGLVDVHLERQLSRFTRVDPTGHPCMSGWVDAVRYWQRIDGTGALGGEAFIEALPVSLMKEVSLRRLSRGPDLLDNLCAAVMLASGCAVSAHVFDSSSHIGAEDFAVPFPWGQAIYRGSRIGTAEASLNTQTVLCVSGVRGSDLQLAQTLLDVILYRGLADGSSLCWTARMAGSRPSAALHWHRERTEASLLPA